MNEHRAPTSDELRAYAVLINFLHQVRSNYQDINDEAERFNRLLEQQCEVLESHRADLEDLTSALSDYEDEMERVKGTVPLDQQHNQLPGYQARRRDNYMKQEMAKAEDDK